MNGTAFSENSANTNPGQSQDARHVRLPGFTADTEVGLGDLVTRATSSLGIPTCGDCARRAAALNRRVVFTGKKRI